MRHGSLFSGIGGFDLAAEWMGWENVFHCEWNSFGQKVLKYYWPKAISYDDITKTDFTVHRGNIDILTGGFPCQPYSSAGKRKGKEDERHLWPQMLRAIREIAPSWVVGENVYGLVNWSGGLVFHEVQSDLEAEGYEVFPFLLPAVSVNAPHRRDRIWFVAKNTISNGCLCRESKEKTAEIWQQRNSCTRISDRVYLSKRDATNTNNNGLNECNSNNEVNASEGREYALDDINKSGGNGDAADSNNKRLERNASERIQTNERGKYGLSNAIINRLGEQSKWQTFPSVSPICIGDDGLSNRLDSITFPKWRNESIKAGGNAIVPQVVYQIFKTIEQYEREHITRPH